MDNSSSYQILFKIANFWVPQHSTQLARCFPKFKEVLPTNVLMKMKGTKLLKNFEVFSN